MASPTVRTVGGPSKNLGKTIINMTCQASLLTIEARTAEGAPSWHLIRNIQTQESQRDVKSTPDQGKNSRRKRKMWNTCLALLFTGDHSVRKSGDLPSEGH